MPRETLEIRTFDKGLINAADAQDIPIGAATYSWNLDNIVREVALRGRRSDLRIATTVMKDCETNVLLSRESSAETDLVYVTNDGGSLAGVYTNEGFPSGVNVRAVALPSEESSKFGNVTVFNRTARFGWRTMPQWAGRTSDGVLRVMDAALAKIPYTITATQSTTINGTLDPSKRYYYSVAFEYDGFQISPLDTAHSGMVCNGVPGPTKTLDIAATFGEALNARISGILLFRAESSFEKSIPDTSFRLVYRFGPANIAFADIGYPYQSAYDSMTGIPETLRHDPVRYRLSTFTDGCMFVADCAITAVDGSSHMLLRSRPNRPDMFNWAEEYLYLPSVPRAMTSFGGRLYVFDENSMHRINPQSMVIEDSMPGLGCVGAEAVLATEVGMFIATSKMLYWHDGRTPIPMGKAVATILEAGWITSSVKIVWHAASESVLFFKPGEMAEALVFTPSTKRWDYWSFGISPSWQATPFNKGVIVGKSGSIYLPCWLDAYSNPELLQLAEGTTRTYWSWISGDMTLTEISQMKKIYKIKTIVDPLYTGTQPTVQYTFSQTIPFTTLSGESLPSNSRLSKQIRLSVAGASNTVVRGLDIVYRAMIGKR